MLQETVAIRTVHKRDVQYFGIFNGLLHSRANAVFVILCFDDSQWDIGLVVEQIVCAFSLSSGRDISADDDATIREVVLHANLLLFVPAGALNGWGNELKFGVLLSHFMFFHKVVHTHASFCCF